MLVQWSYGIKNERKANVVERSRLSLPSFVKDGFFPSHSVKQALKNDSVSCCPNGALPESKTKTKTRLRVVRRDPLKASFVILVDQLTAYLKILSVLSSSKTLSVLMKISHCAANRGLRRFLYLLVCLLHMYSRLNR